MSKFCIFVKSQNKSTYKEAIKQALMVKKSVETIVWCFFGIKKDVALVQEATGDLGCEYIEVKTAADLKPKLQDVTDFDISALPKEDLAEVLSVLIPIGNARAYTLTRSESRSYIDLMGGEGLRSFRKWHRASLRFSQLLIGTIIVGVGAYGLVRVSELFPHGSSFSTWIGITIGIAGLISGWFTRGRS